MNESLFIVSIQKKERERFTIEWSDGKLLEYRLSEIQRRCPCAVCRGGNGSVDEAVGAVRIMSVGRYALQFVFTSGCSEGIYSFAELRSLK